MRSPRLPARTLRCVCRADRGMKPVPVLLRRRVGATWLPHRLLCARRALLLYSSPHLRASGAATLPLPLPLPLLLLPLLLLLSCCCTPSLLHSFADRSVTLLARS